MGRLMFILLMDAMKYAIVCGTLAWLSTRVLFGGDGTIHQEWIEQDRAFVAEVKAVLKNDGQHADRVLFWFPVPKKNLGFGYALAERYVGKGYLGFWCQMLYFHDELVSFRLTPGLGIEK